MYAFSFWNASLYPTLNDMMSENLEVSMPSRFYYFTSAYIAKIFGLC